MSVEFNCPTCGKMLRVPDENAGHKAECPACRAVCDVPSVDRSARENDTWKVRTPEGEVYGPVSKAELDQWLAEGRLSESCHIMHGGGPQWRPASEIYASVRRPSMAAGAASQYVPPTGNPYMSPGDSVSAVPSAQSYAQPHRGALILVFGILGFMVCGLFGIAAWIMGRDDLAKMNAGVMDRSGYGLTQAGWILGIIATLLLAIPLVIVAFMLFAAIVGGF